MREHFEVDERVQLQIDRVYGLMEVLNRGDVLAHTAIQAVLCCAPHENGWDHVVNMARRRLERSRGIATWPETTIGYRLLSHQEQIQIGEWRTKRASRQLRKARKSIQALPDSELSMRQRRAKLAGLDALSATAKAVRQGMDHQKRLFTPTVVSPRRPQIQARAGCTVKQP